MKHQSPLNDNGEKDVIKVGGTGTKAMLGLDEVVVSSGGDSKYDPAYDILTDHKYIDPDTKVISVDNKPVVAGDDPITQEEMDYYTNLNELYPEYIYKTGGKRKFPPGYRGSDQVPGALMPKSTSVEHTKDLMKKDKIFWTDARKIIDEMPGYKPINR